MTILFSDSGEESLSFLHVFATKVKYFAEFVPYILIYGIFFVTLRPDLCVHVCACTKE